MDSYFHFNDRSKAILQIQEWIRFLASKNSGLLSLSLDGIYSEKTREAVRIFQKEYDLKVTGIVDYTTWEKLKKECEKEQRREERNEGPIYPFHRFFCEKKCKKGDRALFVYILKVMLESISLREKGENSLRIDDLFDKETEEKIMDLQRRWGIPITGEVDTNTWNLLASTYNYGRDGE